MNIENAVSDDSPNSVSNEALAKAKAMVGYWLKRSCNSVRLDSDLIRNYAFSLGDENPLYHDADYAVATRYRSISAPPYVLVALPPLHAAGKLAGLQWIYGACGFELLRPIRADDTITTHARLTSVEPKDSANAGRIVNQISEVLYVNQHGQLAAIGRPTLVRTVRGNKGRQMAYKPRRAVWEPEELRKLEALQLSYRRRGNITRYAEDVAVGETLPVLAKGPLRAVEFAFSGFDAQEGWFGFGQGAHVYQALRHKKYPTDTYYDPQSGLRDTTYRGHWEAFMAREVGMPGMYDMGHHRVGIVSQVVSGWAGDNSWLSSVYVKLIRPLVASDALYVSGTVRAVNADGSVDINLDGAIQDGQTVATGTATVLLPKRSGPSRYNAHAESIGL